MKRAEPGATTNDYGPSRRLRGSRRTSRSRGRSITSDHFAWGADPYSRNHRLS